MRMKGFVKVNVVHMLVYLGSTHNFMDVDIAEKLGIQLETIPAFSVIVANGSRFHSKCMRTKVKWKMQM